MEMCNISKEVGKSTVIISVELYAAHKSGPKYNFCGKIMHIPFPYAMFERKETLTLNF